MPNGNRSIPAELENETWEGQGVGGFEGPLMDLYREDSSKVDL